MCHIKPVRKNDENLMNRFRILENLIEDRLKLNHKWGFKKGNKFNHMKKWSRFPMMSNIMPSYICIIYIL